MHIQTTPRKAELFTAGEARTIERVMVITFLAVALQVMAFPSLGWWAASLIGLGGTAPIALSLYRGKLCAVVVLVILAAIAAPLYQILVRLGVEFVKTLITMIG